MRHRYNGNSFTVYDDDEFSMLEIVEDHHKAIMRKTDLYGDHKGSWQGLNKPTLSEEGLRATVEKHIKDIDNIYNNIDGINSDISVLSKVNNIASVNMLNTFRDEDCILITTNNGKTILIDSGESFSEGGILERIDSLGITKLDYFIITHFHSDHAGNAAVIIDKYKPTNIYYKEVFWDMLSSVEIEWNTKGYFEKFISACERNNITPNKVTSDLLIPISHKENIKLLNSTFIDYSDYNSASLMILYNNGKTNCLFPGDVTTVVLDSYKKAIPQLSLYKAAHHGGYDKNISESFMSATRPKITHINGEGLPYSKETMDLAKWCCNGDVYVDGEYGRSTHGYLISETGVYPSNNLKKISFSEYMFEYKDNWYLCDNVGELIQKGIVSHKGNLCYVDNFIYVTTPMWISYNGYDYCIDENGYIMCNRWKQSEDTSTPDKWYYLDHNGRMLKNTSRLLDGKMITFDNDGIASPKPI